MSHRRPTHFTNAGIGKAPPPASSGSSSDSPSPGSWLWSWLKSPWAVGAVVAVGLGAVGLAYRNVSQAEKQRQRSEKLKKLICTSFASEQFNICRRMTLEPWCVFDEEEVTAIHQAVCDIKRSARKAAGADLHEDDLQDGRLARSEIIHVYEGLGVHDDQILDNLYRVLDTDHDGHVSFYELVQGLNTIVHGSPRDKLQRYFIAFDIDRNGLLDVHEMERAYTAFYAHQPPAEIKRAAADFIKDLDRNADGKVSLSEFVDSYMAKIVDDTSNDEFNSAFCRKFGLDIGYNPADVNV
eukprot:TRINITY_DN50759_c0_g1_i1.p1 TRINITY_DN50759_c0_g1~~TRINITY_DN50759_c0_g1_i1.p1  ORF type:complete len:304 (-),score=128.62 TRINITY_DN50759_c0_g1_i1:49-936(-)